MKRWPFLAAAALLTMAASPTPRYPPLAMIQQPLPRPPVPPAAAPQQQGSPLSEYTPAPVPDQEAYTPIPSTPPSAGGFTPGLIRPYKSRMSDGYTPNSSVEGEQQKKWKPAPSLNFSVPLE